MVVSVFSIVAAATNRLSPAKSVFSPQLANVGFVVHKVAVGQVSLRVRLVKFLLVYTMSHPIRANIYIEIFRQTWGLGKGNI